MLAGALGLVLLVLAPALGVALPAPTVLRTVGIVGLLSGIALATSGLGALVFEPVLAGGAEAAAGFGSHRVVLATTAFATLLAALVSNLVPLLALGLTGQRGLRNVPGFFAASTSVSLVLLAVAYLRFIRPRVISVADFGLARNRLAPWFFENTWLAHLGCGLVGGVLIIVLSNFVQLFLRQFGVEQTQLTQFTWVRGLSEREFDLIWLSAAVIGPLGEEVFFRGLVFRSYLVSKGAFTAYVTSSLVFALLHLNAQAFAPILVLGLVLAWLYHTSDSLVPGLLAHGLNNGVALIALYKLPPGMGPGGV